MMTNLKVLDKNDVGGSILEYLGDHGGIYRGDIVLLKSRNVSNLYFDARILNKKEEVRPGVRRYVHEDFLMDAGRLIREEAKQLGADTVVGIVKTGATLAMFVDAVSRTIAVRYVDPHDSNPLPSGNVMDRKILIVDDTTTTGGSIADVVDICKALGAEIVGALTLVRRDPRGIREVEVGLNPAIQQFVSLADIDFEIITEPADHNESALLKSALKSNAGGPSIRLDVGYAATDNWSDKYPQYRYTGSPVIKK